MKKLICGAIETSLLITVVLLGGVLLMSCVLPTGNGAAVDGITQAPPMGPGGIPLDFTTVGGAIGAAAVIGDYIRRIIKGRSVKKSLTIADEQISNLADLLGQAKEVEAVIVTAVEEIRKSSSEAKANFTVAIDKALRDSDLTAGELKTYIMTTKADNSI